MKILLLLLIFSITNIMNLESDDNFDTEQQFDQPIDYPENARLVEAIVHEAALYQPNNKLENKLVVSHGCGTALADGSIALDQCDIG